MSRRTHRTLRPALHQSLLDEVDLLVRERRGLTVRGACRKVAKHHYRISAESLYETYRSRARLPIGDDRRRVLSEDEEQELMGHVHGFALMHVRCNCSWS